MKENFCCVDISTTPQNTTNCTIEKLHARIKNKNDALNPEDNSPNSSSNSLGILSSYCIINYLKKDLKCPASNGCFEIRIMTFTESEDAFVSFCWDSF